VEKRSQAGDPPQRGWQAPTNPEKEKKEKIDKRITIYSEY
jgi:hypothetical protein